MSADTEEIDLFEEYEKMPIELKAIIDKYNRNGDELDYIELESMLLETESIGYTFEYSLDAVVYELREMTDEELKLFAEKKLFVLVEGKRG